MGFDYFYGFLGGETDQWTPFMFRNTTQIFPWRDQPGYNMITGMADDAIHYLKELNAAAPDKPFFLYYVPGGTDAPHQPSQEWIDKFKGKFDMGLEQITRANLRQPEAARGDPAEHCVYTVAGRPARVRRRKAAEMGHTQQRLRRSSSPLKRRCSPPTLPTPTMKSAASSRKWQTRASSTIRSSSTSVATTARARSL